MWDPLWDQWTVVEDHGRAMKGEEPVSPSFQWTHLGLT